MELSQRQMMLLELLHNHQGYCTVEHLARKLGVSKRTVHHELERINPFIVQENKRLKKKPGVGIKIVERMRKKENNTKISKSSRLTVERRRLAILYRLLFEEKTVTQQALSDDYFVSKSSIQNDLNFINRHFVTLTGDYSGTYILADEKIWQITHLKFNQYVMSLDSDLTDKTGVLERYYPPDIVSVCHYHLLKYIRENGINISDIYIQNILSILIILMYRIRKGFHHTDIPEQKMTLNKENILKEINKISAALNITPNQSDINFLFSQLFSNRFNVTAVVNIDYIELTKRLINEAEKLTGVPFSSDRRLYKQLLLHIPPMINRMQTGSTVKNPSLLEIKNELNFTYNILHIAIKNIEKEIKVKLNEDEIAFLALYFQVAQERIQPVRRILVVCPMGIAASELLVNRLRNIVSEQDILQSASVAELERLELERFDLILSTVDLKGIEREWFKISLFVNEEDVRTLLNIKKRTYRKERASDVQAILNLTEGYYRIMHMDAPNKQTLLEKVTAQLVKHRQVSEHFLAGILERERLSSTDLPGGVATPHGSPKHVYQTNITIVKNKRKIKWCSYYVDIIFLICIAEKDLTQTKQIISKIYRMIDEPKVLNALRVQIGGDFIQ